jgi:chromosome segregation ATPase
MEAEGLPADVRKMLCADLKNTLGAPKAERHQFQERVIAWIGDALKSVETTAKKELEAVEAEVNDQEAEKARRVTVQEEATSALNEKRESEKAKEASVKDASAVLKAKKSELKEAEKEQKEGNKQLDATQAVKEKLSTSMTDCFLKLNTEGALAEDAEARMSTLLGIAQEYDFDKSMVASLRSCLLKATDTRGEFDNMVVNAFQEQLQKRIATVEGTLETGAAEKVTRDAKVEAASAAVAAAEGADASAKGELEKARQEVKDAEATHKDAAQSAKQFASDMKAKIDEVNTARKRVMRLEKGPLAAFAELENLGVPPPEPPAPENQGEATQDAAAAAQ